MYRRKWNYVSNGNPSEISWGIEHVNNIPTMQSFAGISWNTRSKSYTLSLAEFVRDFQNNALLDTH